MQARSDSLPKIMPSAHEIPASAGDARYAARQAPTRQASAGSDGDAVEAFDLIVLTLGVFGRESGVGFEHADLRGGLEPLGQ